MKTKRAAEHINARECISISARTTRSILFGLLLLLLLSLVAESAPPAAPLTGENAIKHLKTVGQYESLAAAITSARYAVKPVEDRAENPKSSAFWAQNPAHGMNSTFSPEGLTFTVRTGDGADASAHTVGWRLRSLGYGAAQMPVPAGTLRTMGQRVELERTTPAITEWFHNEPGGLEHGFTLPERPASNPRGEPLRVVLAVTGGLTPQADASGQNLALCDAAGLTVLTYAKLKVWDAAGAELPASMLVADGQVTFTVADATARYPLTIDPTFLQQAYLKTSNTGASDGSGYSVAVSGDTVVVGADQEDSSATGVNGDQSDNSASASGAVYVFVRSGTNWSHQAYLKASNTGAADRFGESVAVSGDTMVVGARNEDSSATGVNGDGSNNGAGNSGAAYVFARSGTNWTQQAYLKASNTGASDQFGESVAVSGDTVVVGAASEDSNAIGVNGNQSDNSASGSGAAYVFVRSGTTWTQQTYLKASNTDAGDQFGYSVATSGDTALVGAYGEGSSATGVNGDANNNGAGNSGAAYVFVRSGTTWTQQAYLKASNTGAGDLFGDSVALSSDMAVVGADGEASNATGVNGNQSDNSASASGAAYVFVRSGTNWTQQAYLKASNTGTDDSFGLSVAAAGDTVVVGAYTEDSSANGINGNQIDNNAIDAGAAYVFQRSGTNWTQQAYLKASNTGAGDRFGESVAVAGDSVVVGAPGEESNATGVDGDGSNNSAANSGAAYVFEIYACVPPPPGLVLWQPLDELTGTSTVNLSPGGSNGTFINNPTHTSGYVGNSLCFDGTSRYVNVPDYAAINPGTGDFSVDAWVKRDPASGNGVRVLFDKRDASTQIGYHLVVSFGNLLLQLTDASGQTNFRDTGTVPADNQWHFVAVTENRTSTTGGQFYVDGAPTGTFNPTARQGSLNNTNAFQVGRSPLGGNSPWLGCIDEVEVFNRSLSAAEVASLYDAGSSGKCKPPVISEQPASLNATVGQQATFAVTAQGTGTFSYQWYRNGAAIAGATSASLVIESVTFSSAGLYHAVITGPFGVTTTQNAQLLVTGPDLWIRDDVSDVGNEPNAETGPVIWTSDDIWVRRTADDNYDPHPFPSANPTWIPQLHEGPCYRDPKTSSPNYLYVRVRNRGNAPSSGTEELHVYWAKAATGLAWPIDWNDNMESIAGGPVKLYGYEVTKPRKNGATATAQEKADYWQAIQMIDAAPFLFPDSTYFDKQNTVHANLFNAGIHGFPRFLPWHREFVNRYEVLLREAKPTLTVLYWDWTTDPDPAIVSLSGVAPAYMGKTSGAAGAPFASFNLIRGKQAGAPGASGLSPSYQSGTLLQPNTTYASFRAAIEAPSHNSAHGYLGGTVTTPSVAASDPLFFMLHANCDRLWALWQRLNTNRWTPALAYDQSQANPALSPDIANGNPASADLKPWDGTSNISPWTSAGGYIIKKTPLHHSIVYPPIYDDAPLRIPVLNAGECAIIEIPFYPPSSIESAGFSEPQHLCLLARIEPVSVAEIINAPVGQNVRNNNNIAWKNVTLDDCNVGPFFTLAPGRVGAAGELVRNIRTMPATVTLRFDETLVGGNSLFNFGQVRVRLEQNLMTAWLNGGSQGVGITQAGPQEILVSQTGATIAGLPLAAREKGRMDVALQLNQGYPHPNGAIFHLEVIQSDSQSGGSPVGGQRYDLDFNSLELVAKGAEWKFLDGGAVPAGNWQQLNFDDQAWTTGMALFGFSRPDVETGLLGIDAQTPATCYFRKVFDVPDPTFFQNLGLDLLQDDGVIVYLNGQEIARRNMPIGAVTPQTAALAPMVDAGARAYRSIDVSSALGLLVVGPNVLAAEVHPAAANPQVVADITFDLELGGNVPSTPYQPPTVVAANPRNGDVVKAGIAIPIAADVVDPDGNLTEVRIFGDGALLATRFAPPFTAVFSNPAAGAHRVSVEALDQTGRVTPVESVFAAVTNLPPSVEITRPHGETFASNAPVVLTADAADPDGTVAEVRFYVKSHASFGSPILFAGADQAAPFAAQISGLESGMYVVTAEVTDIQGAIGYSSSGHFMVAKPPGVALLGINLELFGSDQAAVLDWAVHGAVLEHTPNLLQPWEPMPDAMSPFLFGITEPMGFFRLRLPTSAHCACAKGPNGVCNCSPCNCRP